MAKNLLSHNFFLVIKIKFFILYVQCVVLFFYMGFKK
jgi:hypothetical protein